MAPGTGVPLESATRPATAPPAAWAARRAGWTVTSGTLVPQATAMRTHQRAMRMRREKTGIGPVNLGLQQHYADCPRGQIAEIIFWRDSEGWLQHRRATSRSSLAWGSS